MQVHACSLTGRYYRRLLSTLKPSGTSRKEQRGPNLLYGFGHQIRDLPTISTGCVRVGTSKILGASRGNFKKQAAA